ncbi:exodeoxyribonuclease III [Candidatus Saccharibacteria bacterium]|nr:exodeoxyribonuclease III [Candidatus Saccharibacteria bacterium]
MKIVSWNVNGLRAILKKGNLTAFLKAENPDIVCIQETKAKQGQAEVDFPEYEEIWNSAERPGYSGTAVFSKIKPIAIRNDFPTLKDAADQFGDPLTEGRVLTVEFPEFFLVNVYTPNSKRSLERLELRHKTWDPAFLNYLKDLEKSKPVITCGDYNAAHTEIDIARPKENQRNAGFTVEERKGITNLISAGFVDTFRTLNPDKIQYTWWSHMGNARARNIGWRIDYFFVSDSLKSKLKSATIFDQIMGSDHCPISIEINL